MSQSGPEWTQPKGGVLGDASYYPFRQLLDCDGANFSSSWGEFRVRVAENARQGFVTDEGLLDMAKRIHTAWEEDGLG
eukprot:s4020_g7.t1